MIKTSCLHCIFKITDGQEQNGCELNRLDKYNKHLVDGYYELDGYCNFCRNVYWDKAESPDRVSEVKKEEHIKYSVIYDFDGDKDALLLQSLSSAAGENAPVDFVICYNNEINVSITDLYYECRPLFNNTVITQSIDDEMNVYSAFELAVKKAIGNYLYFIERGHEIDKNCVSHLNSLVNDEAKTVYMVASKDFVICYKPLFEKYAHMERPMLKLHDALIKSKYKDSVIKWPLTNQE